MSTRDEIKESILKRALIHVPFDGWSKDLLERAAVEAGVDPSYSWRLFPLGTMDATKYWSERLDQEMLATLPSPEGLKVREKITLATRTRISLLTPHREAALKTAKYLAHPQHMGHATRMLYRTVSEIWYYAGDTSTDYNFYTKRGLLSLVYSSTFLYWLKDDSDQFEKTWKFLDRRIENVLKLPNLPKRIIKKVFPWKRHG